MLKAVDNVNDHLHGRKRMEKEDIKVCELALKHALPALKQIDGLPQEINDNRVIIQVLKLANDTNTGTVETKVLPAAPMELPRGRGEEI